MILSHTDGLYLLYELCRGRFLPVCREREEAVAGA